METIKKLLFGKKKEEKDSWGTVPKEATAEPIPEQKEKKDKKVEKDSWVVKPKEQTWSTVEKNMIPGNLGLKKVIASLLILIYVASLFTVALEPYTAGMILLTIYILLDYMMLIRR